MPIVRLYMPMTRQFLPFHLFICEELVDMLRLSATNQCSCPIWKQVGSQINKMGRFWVTCISQLSERVRESSQHISNKPSSVSSKPNHSLLCHQSHSLKLQQSAQTRNSDLWHSLATITYAVLLWWSMTICYFDKLHVLQST